jgi:hypothetical protein
MAYSRTVDSFPPSDLISSFVESWQTWPQMNQQPCPTQSNWPSRYWSLSGNRPCTTTTKKVTVR